MQTKEEFIVEVWELLKKDVVGASVLGLIQDAVAERFGDAAVPSPALIARVLADTGAQLRHPQILEADSSWRKERTFFAADDLAFDTIDASTAFIEKVEHLRREFEQDQLKLERLRLSVQKVKTELDSVAASQKVSPKSRAVAVETAQWLTFWLQNPQIFPEWLALRRNTTEFQELFGTFTQPGANTSDQRLIGAHEP